MPFGMLFPMVACICIVLVACYPIRIMSEMVENKPRGAGWVVLSLVLQLLFGVLLVIKSRSAALHYLYACIPLVLLTVILGNYYWSHHGNMKLFGSFAILTGMGMALQFLVDEVYQPVSVFAAWKMFFAIAIAFVFVGFYALVREALNKPVMMWLAMLATAGIYVALLLFGSDPNGYGTYAWISVGGHTVQLTEFTKVFAVLFYGSLFTCYSVDDLDRILRYGSVYFLINLVGSVLIHELGSFFIQAFLYLSILYIFMPHSRKKRLYILVFLILGLGSVVLAFVLYKLMLPGYMAGTLNGFLLRLWPFVKKIYTRVSLTANLQSDPYGAGYQLLQGKKAMWMAGLFGNTVHFSAIPVAESDMAYIALLNGFGWVFGVLVIYLFLNIMREGSEMARAFVIRSRADGVVLYGITVCLFLQAMMVILGSCNLIPFAGLPIPFLSRGGTYQTIVFCFAGVMMHMSLPVEGGEVDEFLGEQQPEDAKPDQDC